MRKVRFTPEARSDLVDIVDYTHERFGLKQALEYRDGFAQVFSHIAEHPLIGSDQNHIQQDLRRIVHQSHVIYYRLKNDEVVVARVLGPGQDPLQEF